MENLKGPGSGGTATGQMRGPGGQPSTPSNPPPSTVDESNRLSPTLADIYDGIYKVPSTFDLPIDDVKDYVNDLLIKQIGTEVTVDGNREHVLISDLKRVYTNMQSNMKKCVFLHATEVKRGSKIVFPNYAVAIVYTAPNDDIVSKSARIVVCNNKMDFFEEIRGFDENPKSPTYGDVLDDELHTLATLDVFIERIQGDVGQHDVGLLQSTRFKVIACQDEVEKLGLKPEGIVRFQNRFYEIGDIDTITPGVSMIQIGNTRKDYTKYIVT